MVPLALQFTRTENRCLSRLRSHPCLNPAMRAIVCSRIIWPSGRPPWLLNAVALLAYCAATGSLAAAELELKSVFPFSCQLGASVEITLLGAGLDKGGFLHFSRPGLSAEHLENDRFRVTASDDAAVGDCELWVATAEGLAGPRRFSITPMVVIAEQEGDDTRAGAQEVTLPAAINGRFDKTGDLDWFTFEGQEEQLITIKCRSSSLDGSANPVFTLLGPAGRELAHSSSRDQEPRITYRLPTTGPYCVLLHDRAYRKDDFSFYQLEVSTGPLDGTSIERTAGLLRPDDLFSAISIQDEQEQSREEPHPIELPCRVAGQLVNRNEVDWFRFQAKENQVVHVEAFGERLGQLMDLEVAVYNAEDKQVKAASDLAAPKGTPAALPLASLDPTMTWKVPADGEYSVALRDLYGGSVFGPDRIYELIVAIQKPNFFAVVMPATSKPSRGVFVKQGAKAACSLTVIRTSGFAGPVNIRLVDPAPGLTAEPSVVDGKEITKPIHVAAANDAPAGFQSIRLVAESQIGSDQRTIPVFNVLQIRAGKTRRVDEMVIYVSK